MSAMLDVVAGSAFKIEPGMLRQALARANATARGGSGAPHVLASSLSAPYADGFAFVQARRARGGWTAVDEVLRVVPESTEQILHPEKYETQQHPVDTARAPIQLVG